MTEEHKDISINHDGIITIAAATGKSSKSKLWKNKNIKWSDFLKELSQTKRTKETVSEFMAMSKAEKGKIKDVNGFVGGELKEDGRRTNKNIKNRSLITLDIDYGSCSTWDSVTLMIGCACCLYSTHSHRLDNPRCRLIIPLSRPVTPEEYGAVSRMLASWIDIEIFDDTTFEIARLMYNPSTSVDGEYYFKYQDGNWLNPDEILKEYTFGWQDMSYWPQSKRSNKNTNKSIKDKQQDPLLKDGPIGAFCRTYSISQAIAEFLSDAYLPCDDGQRYTYAAGSTFAGIIVYDDKFSFSHHATDPAGGRLNNSFDLVRLHKFGELDNEVRSDTKNENLPSLKKMIEFVNNDKKASYELLREEFSETNSIDEAEKKVEEARNYIIATSNGLKVNTGLLAEYIRKNSNYMIVRKQGYDNDLLYWYENGVYKRISANELKGRIKKYIPEKIRTPNQWENVYKELLTDVNCVAFEELDTNRDFINLKNGLYNIKTKGLEPHSEDIKSTIQINCSYNPNALEPTEWIKYIKNLSENDKEIEMILQEWFGLVISNIDAGRLKKCLALYGEIGNTGKTQYNNMLIYMLGKDNICSVPIQDLNKNFAIGDLYGKRALIIDDQTSINLEDSSNFKALTGGGVVRCEIKGKQAFPFVYTGTITFGCNDLPYIKDDKGDHVFNRLLLIPCRNIIPLEKQKVNIIEKFKTESEGIFLWSLEGLNRLMNNDYKFTKSKRSREALEDYRQVNDSLYRFLRSEYSITKDKNDRVKKTDFEYEYSLWASQEEINGLEKKNIKNRMLKHGISCIPYNGYPCYLGLLKLKT